MGWRRFALFGMGLTLSGQTNPTFNTTTKLVQVNVVARDQDGAPVADLRREEFEILDNGAPQEIRVFVAEATKKSAPAARESLPPDTYTNRMAASDPNSGYSAILFDNLLTDFGEGELDGTGFGVQKVLQALQRMPQSEQVAIYAIGRKLKVIHEFTTDRESIKEELRKWKPSPDDSVTGTALCRPFDGRALLTVTPGQAESVMSCYRNDHLQRTAPFDEELNQVADHLAGIPGRKKLIWMANQWPAVAPSTLRKFVDARISIYPVDEGGVKGGGGQPDLAALTGGVNFARRNDLEVGVNEAIEDGRVGYTLGFYPSGGATEPSSGVQAGVHQITIRVTRPGLTLRYATSYQADIAPKRTPSLQDLIDALNRRWTRRPSALRLPRRATGTCSI
jgi:VWFA-related protein